MRLSEAHIFILLGNILSAGAMMAGSASSYSSAQTILSFSIESGNTTAYCDLSFITDFTCISQAQVLCTLIGEDAENQDMGKLSYSGDFITKIDGTAYNIDAIISLYPSSNTISSLIICMVPTCGSSSSSLGNNFCLDYSTPCGSSSSSSSSRSSSSPSHSEFKYISSSYLSFYSSSSSSSSSSSKSIEGEGQGIFFGSSPTISSSSSTCSVADFGWSSGSEGVVFAWPSFESSSDVLNGGTSLTTSSSSTTSSSFSSSGTNINRTSITGAGTTTVITTDGTTTGFTTTGGVTNSKGSLI